MKKHRILNINHQNIATSFVAYHAIQARARVTSKGKFIYCTLLKSVRSYRIRILTPYLTSINIFTAFNNDPSAQPTVLTKVAHSIVEGISNNPIPVACIIVFVTIVVVAKILKPTEENPQLIIDKVESPLSNNVLMLSALIIIIYLAIIYFSTTYDLFKKHANKL